MTNPARVSKVRIAVPSGALLNDAVYNGRVVQQVVSCLSPGDSVWLPTVAYSFNPGLTAAPGVTLSIGDKSDGRGRFGVPAEYA